MIKKKILNNIWFSIESSNVRAHAKKELDILLAAEPDSGIKEFENEILMLCEKFGQSGQSGGSASFVANYLTETIKKLVLFKTLSPLTGEDDEWYDVGDFIGDGKTSLFQNNRNSAVFKSGIHSKAYYIDAIVKRAPNGNCWSGNFWASKEDYLTGNKDLMINSFGYIKSFPFIPKTFYIDVIEEEVAKDDWEMWVKDPEQLKEFYNYYDKIK